MLLLRKDERYATLCRYMRDWNEEAQVQQACCRDAVSKQYVMQLM